MAWVCQTPGCNATHADTLLVCPHCDGESPSLQAAKAKAINDALAAKAAAASLEQEQAAEKSAADKIAAAVKDAVA